jgi:hypothetical protein
LTERITNIARAKIGNVVLGSVTFENVAASLVTGVLILSPTHQVTINNFTVTGEAVVADSLALMLTVKANTEVDSLTNSPVSYFTAQATAHLIMGSSSVIEHTAEGVALELDALYEYSSGGCDNTHPTSASGLLAVNLPHGWGLVFDAGVTGIFYCPIPAGEAGVQGIISVTVAGVSFLGITWPTLDLTVTYGSEKVSGALHNFVSTEFNVPIRLAPGVFLDAAFTARIGLYNSFALKTSFSMPIGSLSLSMTATLGYDMSSNVAMPLTGTGSVSLSGVPYIGQLLATCNFSSTASFSAFKVHAALAPITLNIPGLQQRFSSPTLDIQHAANRDSFTVTEFVVVDGVNVGAILFDVTVVEKVTSVTLGARVGPISLGGAFRALGVNLQLPTWLGLMQPLVDAIFSTLVIQNLEVDFTFGKTTSFLGIGSSSVFGIVTTLTLYNNFATGDFLVLIDINAGDFAKVADSFTDPLVKSFMTVLGVLLSGGSLRLGYSSFVINADAIAAAKVSNYLLGQSGLIMALPAGPPNGLTDYLTHMLAPGTPFACLAELIFGQAKPVPVASVTGQNAYFKISVDLRGCGAMVSFPQWPPQILGFPINLAIDGVDPNPLNIQPVVFVRSLEFYCKIVWAGAYPSISVGARISPLQIGVDDAAFAVYGDFAFGLEQQGLVPSVLTLKAAVSAYKMEKNVDLHTYIVKMEPGVWTNPFYANAMLGLKVPMGGVIQINIDLIQAAIVVANTATLVAHIAQAVASVGVAVQTVIDGVLDLALSVVQCVSIKELILSAGITSPAGIRPRYSAPKHGDMDMSAVVVLDCSTPLSMIMNTVLMLNVTNVSLGRMMYITGLLYMLDDFKLTLAALSQFIHIPGADELIMVYDTILTGMHDLLDLLDQISVGTFYVSFNMGLFEVCLTNNLGCVQPGIIFDLENLNMLGLVTVRTPPPAWRFLANSAAHAGCAPRVPASKPLPAHFERFSRVFHAAPSACF